MMLSTACVLLFVVAIQGCKIQTSHYEELGCKPVYAKPDDDCPQEYDCSSFFARSPNKCHYLGKEYNVGDQIDNDITEINCAASCHCSKGKWADISCANIECPEMMGLPGKPGCFWSYESTSCCTTGEVCPPFDKLATCEVNGKTYYEGQEFPWPEIERSKCVCKPKFRGKFEEPFCSRISCGIELRYTVNVNNKCAPVFYGSDLDCPIDWECQRDQDRVLSNNSEAKTDKKCFYGKLELKVGDKLILDRPSYDPEKNCECMIPPLVTCIQTPYEEH